MSSSDISPLRESAVIPNSPRFSSTDEMTADSTKDLDGQCSTTGPPVRGGGGPGDAGAQGELQ